MRLAPFTALAVALPFVALAKEPAPESHKLESRIMQPDMTKEFHLEQLSPFGRSGAAFRTKGAQTQNFQFQQKFQPKGFVEKKEFRSKGWWGSGFRFSTKAAQTKAYETKAAETKTAAVKEAPGTGKTATVKDLSDGNRPFRGPESSKLNKPLDPTNLPKISSEMRELKTIEDVKELLNKN